MNIEEYNSGISVKKAKSTRDKLLSKNIPENCGILQNSGCYLIIGAPGSGKSNLVNDLMLNKLKNCFHSVYLICPSSSRAGFKDSYTKIMNPERIYDDLDVENLQDIKDEIGEENADASDEKKTKFHCIIIDDCASDLRNKYTQKLLLKMIQNHRHNNTSIFIVVQNLMMVHKNLRDNMTCMIQFKSSSLKEIKTINDEFIPFLKHNECLDLLEYIFKDKYAFLLVNRRDNCICKSYNKLSITTERGHHH